MFHRREVLIATTNQGKVREIIEILGDFDAKLIALAEAGLNLEVQETGATYADNARLKALAYSRASGLVTLADDSGLEVNVLGGAPGLRTARFAGPGVSDADRYNLLLRKMEGVPEAERTAHFRCVVAVAKPAGEIETAEGACEGRIAFAPAGANGFGYDPVFYLPEYGCTMAQLPAEIKNRISHRARAVLAAKPLILAMLF